MCRGIARIGPKGAAHLDLGISHGSPPEPREETFTFGHFTRTIPEPRGCLSTFAPRGYAPGCVVKHTTIVTVVTYDKCSCMWCQLPSLHLHSTLLQLGAHLQSPPWLPYTHPCKCTCRNEWLPIPLRRNTATTTLGFGPCATYGPCTFMPCTPESDTCCAIGENNGSSALGFLTLLLFNTFLLCCCTGTRGQANICSSS